MSDSKFNRNFIAMIIAMTVLTAILMVLASINASEVNANLKSEQNAERLSSISEQIAPVGTLVVATTAAETENIATSDQVEEALNGETVYNGACAACHNNGVAGAPTTGAASQWTGRIAKGIDTLYANAINGINAMPAKGGQAGLSDDAVKAAVDYIIEASK